MIEYFEDRSHGGGSMYDGSIEIMGHRRILHDDSMGVDEVLNETAYGKGLVVSGKHILIFDRLSDSARLHRSGAQQLFMYPLSAYSLPNTSSYTNYSDMYHQSWSALKSIIAIVSIMAIMKIKEIIEFWTVQCIR